MDEFNSWQKYTAQATLNLRFRTSGKAQRDLHYRELRHLTGFFQGYESTSSSLPILVLFSKYQENFTKIHKIHLSNIYFLVG
jgi:hypothetical protein